MDEHNGPDRWLEERLRRGMRPARLSPEQRQRHLHRINARGAWEMDFVRQRSAAELAVVAAVLLIVAAVGIWQFGMLDNNEDGSVAAEPTALANTGVSPAATATLAATGDSPTQSGSSCDVTQFSGSRLENYPAEDVHANWYEGSNIWASPPDINALNPTLPETEHFWFTGLLPVMWFVEAVDVPVVTAEHESNPDATFSYEFQQPYEHWQAHSLLEFSEPGCWDVRATTSDGEIAFTIDVQPFIDRPDAIYQWEQWQASSPFGVPGTCRTTDWVLDDRTGSLLALFWFDGEGISASSQIGLLWEGRLNRIDWIDERSSTDITLTGWLQDDPDVEMQVASSFQAVTHDSRLNRQLETSLVFPEPGCWTIRAESPNASTEFVVYVYPRNAQ